MQSVLEVPDDAVAELQAQALEDRPEGNVEGNDLAIVHVIPNLPAQRAIIREYSHTLLDDRRLSSEVVIECHPLTLVPLPDVIRRGGYDQPSEAAREPGEKL